MFLKINFTILIIHRLSIEPPFCYYQEMKDIRKIYNKFADDYIKSDSNLNFSYSSLKEFKSSLHPGAHILDLGCGSGVFTNWFFKNGFNVTGLDISDEMINHVKTNYPKIKAICGTLEDLPNIKYDGVWCCRVFHHISLSEQDEFINLLASHMSNNAKLYITACIDDKTFEVYDSKNGALKKRLTIDDFKTLFFTHGFEYKSSKDWGNGMWEFFLERNDD